MDVIVWTVIVVGFAAFALVIATGLYRASLTAGSPRSTAVAVGSVFALVWLGWVVVSGMLGAAGVYRQDASAVRPWLVVAFAGVLGAALLAARLPVVARALAVPHAPALLVAPQALRVVGGVFLLVMAVGELPPVFALPAGIGDVAVGVAAVFVARRLRAGTAGRGAVWFNRLGILDLVVALTIGTVAGLLGAEPSTAPVGLLPLVLIPTAAVPLALALHVLALARLRDDAAAPRGRAAGQPAGTS
ncbi:hypothetical protein [Pseudonocardia humida]|uniref:Uncharacterized protein n=1 Tax=Pseudonocardia humida TaxID=2800819 RepID=A0ABT0ZUS6_9PSEU|nr:hypothetical protein [Pseudonocardia humida]MCO1654480.1 hypothetical protein [Pseudonocardia humida]